MKKFVIVFIMTWVILILAGCYFYGAGKAYGQLIDIRVYDLEGHEIEGVFMEEYCLHEDCQQHINIKELNQTNLNSPAPEYLYYVTQVEPQQSYIVEFVIKTGLNYTFKSISINFQTYQIEDLHHYEKIDNHEHIMIRIDDVNEDRNTFRLNSLIVHKTTEESYLQKEGSFNQTGRTYIYGFFFRFNET